MTTTETLSPTTTVLAPVVVVNDLQGGYRLHSATCRDVQRELRLLGPGSLWDDFTVGETLGEYAVREFGDIVSDHISPDDPNFGADCWIELMSGLRALPCSWSSLGWTPEEYEAAQDGAIAGHYTSYGDGFGA